MTTAELKEMFKRALQHVSPYLRITAEDVPPGASQPLLLSDVDKLKFYGFFKQATMGDQPDDQPLPVDPIAAAKVAAWATVRGLSRRDAMRAFVYLLHQAAPTWDAK